MNKIIVRVFIQKIKNYCWHLPKSLFFNLLYGFPSRKLVLIGVTGTDGKTTTVSLIHRCLIEAGINAGVISTLGAKIGNQEIKTGLHTTSPDPAVTQKIFSQMVDSGITHVVVEVTAHAIDQFRYFGCHFQVAGITNVTHEHLDDFLNIQSYTLTKSKLLEESDFSILNRDDSSFASISPHLRQPLTTYSIDQPSDYQAKNVKISANKITFKVNDQLFTTDSVYHHQIYNILLAHAILSQLKIDSHVLRNVIKLFPEIKGRREEVKNDLQIKCIIDFAHTPAALETTLKSLQQNTPGKLIVIFGATGGRDQSKRPLMGKVVSEVADIAIITADDTRNEKVEKINQQIINGITQKNKRFIYHNIPNRQDAFDLAVKLSNSGDTIVACGKGHETTILHGKTEYPWSEIEAFRTAFRQKQS